MTSSTTSYRGALLRLSALVGAMILASLALPTTARSQSFTGLTCDALGDDYTAERYDDVRWEIKACVDSSSLRWGWTPITGGDYGVCSRSYWFEDPWDDVIDCSWSPWITVGMLRDRRELFCRVIGRHSAILEGDVGYLVIACANRAAYFAASFGQR